VRCQTSAYHGPATRSAAAATTSGRIPVHATPAPRHTARSVGRDPATACHQTKPPRAATGRTNPTGPLASTAAPSASPIAALVPAGMRRAAASGHERAATKIHRARVVQKQSAASGVAARPATADQAQVPSARPDQRPTHGSAGNSRVAMSATSSAVPIVTTAEPTRAPVSLTPQTAKPASWIQFTSGGLSLRRTSLNRGTTQSPRASIDTEQAVFLGSSSSHSGADPRFTSSTAAAAPATSVRRAAGVAHHHGGGLPAEEDAGIAMACGRVADGTGRGRARGMGKPGGTVADGDDWVNGDLPLARGRDGAGTAATGRG